MKLPKNDTPTAVLSGVEDAVQYRVAATGPLMQLLSSNLYSNPINACVRELSCNAWDSHIDAGNDKTPFELRLPGRFNPEFSIRDYGTGMDHEKVMDIWTTYGASDKTDSNDATGMMGLGSKVMFGYTNNATLTVYFEGKVRHYALFIDSDSNMPMCAYGGEDDTDEPNGVEIRIPTKEYDHYKWHEAAQQVLQFFPLAPNVDADIEIPELNVRESHSHIDLMNEKPEGFRWGVTWIAQMGNVAYPIEFEKLDEKYNVLAREEKGIINFDIGEVMFTPSREDLFYNSHTINAIQRRLDEFLSEYNQAYTDEQATITNLTEWAEHWRKIRASSIAKSDDTLVSNAREIGTKLRAKLINLANFDEWIKRRDDGWTNSEKTEFKGVTGLYAYCDEFCDLNTRQKLEFVFEQPSTSSYSKTFKPTLARALRSEVGEKDNIWMYEQTRHRQNYNQIGRLSTEFSEFEDVHILVNDLGFSATMITRRWVKEETPFGSTDSLVLFFNTAEAATKTVATLAAHSMPHTVHMLSDENVEEYRNVASRKSSKEASVMMLEKNHDYTSWRANSKKATWARGCSLDTVRLNNHADHVWCEVERYEPTGSSLVSSQYDMLNYVHEQYYNGVKGIVAVKAKDVDWFKDDVNWVHIDDHQKIRVKKQVKELTEIQVQRHLLADLERSDLLEYIIKNSTKLTNKLMTDINALAPSGPNYDSSIAQILREAKQLGIAVKGSDYDVEPLAILLERVYTQVPCLDTLIGVYRDEERQGAIKIINTFTTEEYKV